MFVTVEGSEGAGKSTQLKTLETLCRAHQIDYVLTREPGGTVLGEHIRSLLLTPDVSDAGIDPMAELLMIFAARAQHCAQVIRPALAANKLVLCDRFTDATYAYQGFGRGLPFPFIDQMNALVLDSLTPDLTFFFDVEASTGRQRVRKRGEEDRFEQEKDAFFEKVRQGYLALAKAEPERFRVLDANQSLSSVTESVESLFQNEILPNFHS